MQEFSFYFLLFFSYSFIGWIIEVIHAFWVEHKFINRGFLIGPYCPIYGCGALIMLWLLTGYIEMPIAVFVMGALICSALEYITSYLMEKIFHARWWDYGHIKFNLNGRICLGTAILFGLGGVAILYFFNPLLVKFLNYIPALSQTILFWILFIVFLLDAIFSFNIISNVKREAIRFKSKDNTEEIARKVKEALSKKSIFNRRLIRAFPNIKNITLPLKYIKKKGSKK